METHYLPIVFFSCIQLFFPLARITFQPFFVGDSLAIHLSLVYLTLIISEFVISTGKFYISPFEILNLVINTHFVDLV